MFERVFKVTGFVAVDGTPLDELLNTSENFQERLCYM
jgi:hypothetical protein